MTDHFMRIRFAHEGRALPRRRGPARKTGEGQVEDAPEKMRGAGLADEGNLAAREDVINLTENAPEAIGEYLIVGSVRGVGLKSDGRSNLDRHRPNRDLQPHLAQQGHQLLIEIGDRLRLEAQHAIGAVGDADHELMVDEVKLHLKRPGSVEQPPRRETTRGYTKRDRPV